MIRVHRSCCYSSPGFDLRYICGYVYERRCVLVLSTADTGTWVVLREETAGTRITPTSLWYLTSVQLRHGYRNGFRREEEYREYY